MVRLVLLFEHLFLLFMSKLSYSEVIHLCNGPLLDIRGAAAWGGIGLKICLAGSNSVNGFESIS